MLRDGAALNKIEVILVFWCNCSRGLWQQQLFQVCQSQCGVHGGAACPGSLLGASALCSWGGLPAWGFVPRNLLHIHNWFSFLKSSPLRMLQMITPEQGRLPKQFVLLPNCGSLKESCHRITEGTLKTLNPISPSLPWEGAPSTGSGHSEPHPA